MNLLIVDDYAKKCEGILNGKFPNVNIFACRGEDEALKFIETADILLTIDISDDLMRKGKNIKWIHALISGVDDIINLPSMRKDIIITSTRGIHGPQVSELAFLFMIALNRNLVRNIRNQGNGTWERWPGKLLYKKKVGILGVGVIGKELARKCKAFEMTVYGITSTKRQIECVDHSFGPEGLPEVLQEVDFFINIVPYTPQTHKIIGDREFSMMKPSAFFINLGRGQTTDEEALIDALESGKIAGAGLDAFQEEPLPEDHPLWRVKNVIITPHVGGESDIYVEQALPIFEENLHRFLEGERHDLLNFIEWEDS